MYAEGESGYSAFAYTALKVYHVIAGMSRRFFIFSSASLHPAYLNASFSQKSGALYVLILTMLIFQVYPKDYFEYFLQRRVYSSNKRERS